MPFKKMITTLCVLLAAHSSLAISQNSNALGNTSIPVGGSNIAVSTLAGNHNADYVKDWLLSLSELLRVIQFFNSDGLHCDGAGEDGYNPGAGDTTCTHHNSDYNLADWRINLSELLRAIQFYNSIGSAYHPDPAGEDKFNPGAFGE